MSDQNDQKGPAGLKSKTVRDSLAKIIADGVEFHQVLSEAAGGSDVMQSVADTISEELTLYHLRKRAHLDG